MDTSRSVMQSVPRAVEAVKNCSRFGILLNRRKFAGWEGGKAQLRPRSRFGGLKLRISSSVIQGFTFWCAVPAPECFLVVMAQ